MDEGIGNPSRKSREVRVLLEALGHRWRATEDSHLGLSKPPDMRKGSRLISAAWNTWMAA